MALMKISDILSDLYSQLKKVPSSNLATPGRIVRLTDNLYFCSHMYTTTFGNKEDFDKEDPYPLARNSMKVRRSEVSKLVGVSLPIPVHTARMICPIHPKTGKIFSFTQIDSGPGYVDDFYHIEGTNPKNESGIDMRGNRSVKASVDFWPTVWEEMGIFTFDEAFNGSKSMYLDFLIWEPVVTPVSPAPTKESLQYPNLGTTWFTWERDLLQDWKSKSRPTDVQLRNMVELVKKIIVPARAALGPIRMSSGLRDPATNKAVGGREGSAHLDGRAADLVPVSASMDTLYKWVSTNLKDTVYECVHEGNHVHVSGPIKPGETPNIRVK